MSGHPEHTTERIPNDSQNLQGIAGWLILPAIGLALGSTIIGCIGLVSAKRVKATIVI